MSASTIDFSQEPKKVFLSFLIKQMSEAQFYIFVANGQKPKGLEILDGVISSLNETSQNSLKDDHDLIRRGSMTGGPKIDAREMYQKISKFLAKTYLEECQFGIIPTSTLKPEEDAPTEKIKTRVKAKI